MSASFGPKLGLFNNAAIGDSYEDQFRPFLRAMDNLIQASVINTTTTNPPASPNNGDTYLLLGAVTGAWAGKGNAIAVWSTQITQPGTNVTTPGWDFYMPNPGFMVWNQATSQYYVFNGTNWIVFSTGVTINTDAFTTTAPGVFTVAHGLGMTPRAVTVEMTSGGQVWFQTPTRYDANNVYVVASDAGLSGYLRLFM